jgi:glucokinase
MSVIGIDIRDDGPAAVAVDEAGGVVGRSAQIAGVERVGVSVRDRLDAGSDAAVAEALRTISQGALTAPPRIVTRGAAIALAEQWCGAARGARHVVALTVDECVHAGVAIDGRPFEGAHGLAGAAAWLALNPVERDDYRKLGCLEAEIGTSGIVRRLVWRIKAGDRSRVLDAAGGDFNAITAWHVFDGARSGDGVAISVVRDTARYVGMAVANLAAIIDPDVVVLGGAIAEAADLLLEPAQVEAVRRLPAGVAAGLTVTPAVLGADAAPIGAARAAMTA